MRYKIGKIEINYFEYKFGDYLLLIEDSPLGDLSEIKSLHGSQVSLGRGTILSSSPLTTDDINLILSNDVDFLNDIETNMESWILSENPDKFFFISNGSLDVKYNNIMSSINTNNGLNYIYTEESIDLGGNSFTLTKYVKG